LKNRLSIFEEIFLMVGFDFQERTRRGDLGCLVDLFSNLAQTVWAGF